MKVDKSGNTNILTNLRCNFLENSVSIKCMQTRLDNTLIYLSKLVGICSITSGIYEGELINKGQVLFIIIHLGIYYKIYSESKARIVKIYVRDKKMVGYDSPLILITNM